MVTEDTTLSEQAALVTGAGRGIGRETALALAARGADVAVMARTESDLQDLASEIEAQHDARALVAPADVSEVTAVEDAVAQTAETFGGLDVVVSNAGVAHELTFEEVDTAEYRRVMAANVDGSFFVARAAAPHLREASGHLVFVGSIAGKFPVRTFPVYAASKWWIRGFALSIAGDLGEDDVATTIVNPTSVRTDIGVEAREQSLKEKYEPGEVAEPEDVARSIVHAVTEESPTTVGELDLYRRDEFGSGIL